MAIRQSQSLQKLAPILEFLAECLATSAGEVIEQGRKFLHESAGKTPQARYQKILVQAKKVQEFSMQGVVKWLPETPRRTLERDIATLLKKRSLKARDQLKARTYRLVK